MFLREGSGKSEDKPPPIQNGSSSSVPRRAQTAQPGSHQQPGAFCWEVPHTPSRHRSIRLCDNFAELYDLGRIVMPSCHRDMEVRFATKLTSSKSASSREFVVKVRRKPGSFGTTDEEQRWRANTELVLNLPPSPSIAQVHEVLEDAAGYYVVMEKVEGSDLHETLRNHGSLSVDEIKEVLRHLLHAVADMHASGCIHKDIKLENVMLDRPPLSTSGLRSYTLGRVKLIDFDTVESWTPKSPKAVRVLGTDQYIAPEAYEGRYSPASDMFAVGVIAYRLLCGVFPFRDSIFDDKPGENWVGSPKMRSIRERLNAARLDWQRPTIVAMAPQERSMAQRWVSRLLAINEGHRPSAKEALLDPWLSTAAAAPPTRSSLQRRPSLPLLLASEGGAAVLAIHAAPPKEAAAPRTSPTAAAAFLGSESPKIAQGAGRSVRLPAPAAVSRPLSRCPTGP